METAYVLGLGMAVKIIFYTYIFLLFFFLA